MCYKLYMSFIMYKYATSKIFLLLLRLLGEASNIQCVYVSVYIL